MGSEWTPDRLRKLREKLDLNQTEAAEKVGVSRIAWSSWEQGMYSPSKPVRKLLVLLEAGRLDGEESER